MCWRPACVWWAVNWPLHVFKQSVRPDGLRAPLRRSDPLHWLTVSSVICACVLLHMRRSDLSTQFMLLGSLCTLEMREQHFSFWLWKKRITWILPKLFFTLATSATVVCYDVMMGKLGKTKSINWKCVKCTDLLFVSFSISACKHVKMWNKL